MRIPLAAASGVMVFSGAFLLGAIGGAGPAGASACDAYSGVCPTTPPTTIGGGGGGPGTPRSAVPVPQHSPVTVRGNTSSPAGTLPFTGGEFVLMLTLGGSAVAGGTALVVAGRRRTSHLN